MQATCNYTYATGVLVRAYALHYILATHVCNFLHACVNFYTHVQHLKHEYKARFVQEAYRWYNMASLL